MDAKILKFYQQKISESGIIIDEDVVFMKNHELILPNHEKNIAYKVAVLGTMSLGALCFATFFENCNRLTTGLVVTVPIASSCAVSIYHKMKKKMLQACLVDMLHNFKQLHSAHQDVAYYLKSYDEKMSALDFIRISERSLINLAETTCNIQVAIAKTMQEIIIGLQEGLNDLLLDLGDFQRVTAIHLNYESIKECLKNLSIVEGQMLLLRSHLLTSIYLICSPDGKPCIQSKVIKVDLPLLNTELKSGISGIKSLLNGVRYPLNPPTIVSTRIRQILAESKPAYCQKMKKNVTRINDNICLTLHQLQLVMESLENVKSEDYMIQLENGMRSLTAELFQCYTSSAEFTKFLELLNHNRMVSLKTEELSVARPTQETKGPEKEDIVIFYEPDETGLDDEVFETDSLRDDDDYQAINAFKDFVGHAPEWLIELQQSEIFKKRQTKFLSMDKPLSKREVPSVVNRDTQIEESDEMEKPLSKREVPSVSNCGTQVSPAFPPLFLRGFSEEQMARRRRRMMTPPPPPPLLDISYEEQSEGGSSDPQFVAVRCECQSFNTPVDLDESDEILELPEFEGIDSSLLASLKSAVSQRSDYEEDHFE